MAQPNGTKTFRMDAPDEKVGEIPTTADTIGTRSVFQSLLDSIKALSQDRTFPSILISMEKVPAMEDEIKRLREEERISAKSQKQLLETFNQDRDIMRAKQNQLQEEKTALHADIAQKADTVKSHEAAKKQQADQIQSLKETEVTLREDLDRKAKQIQGLIKAIEAEKQKSRSLQTSLNVQTAESTDKTAELTQLHKIHQRLQHKADWDAKELRIMSELSIPLAEESPNLQPLKNLWFKMASVISSTFAKDISFQDFKIDTFRARLERLGRWSKDLPLPESNSQPAKEMRIVAVLASVSRIFVQQLFRSTYLLSADSGLQELLYRQAKDHSAKESKLRSFILALLPHEQEAVITGAVRTTCMEILDLTNGLLIPTDTANFQERLEDIAEEACEIWQGFRRYIDPMRPSFELKDDEDFIWDQLSFEEGLPVFSDFGQIQDHDHEAAMFAIFPRLYSSFEGEDYPETRGVLFITSHAQAAREEERLARISRPARNSSVRTKLLRGRRPSNRPNSAQDGSQHGFFQEGATT